MARVEEHPLSALYLERVSELVKSIESLKHMSGCEGKKELDERLAALRELAFVNRTLRGCLIILQATLLSIHN